MHAPLTPSVVPDLIREYGAITSEALADALPNKEPQKYLYDLVAEYPRRGGKMMRPCLCIATARCFGASEQEAVKCAVAIELFHNALLIHDDIEDESEERRGQPTLHAQCDLSLALNAGDMLGLLSVTELAQTWTTLGPRTCGYILREAQEMAAQSAEGQAIELGWRHDNTLTLRDEDYLEMVLKKTCWLATIFPMRVGALIGRRSELPPETFKSFGFFLGAAFQIQDDLLNLVADDRYGKELNGDILEGKRTLMLIQLLNEGDDCERARLKTFLSHTRDDRREEDVQWIRSRMDAHGCIERARNVAQGFAGAALHELSVAFADVPDSRDRRFIEGLATWVFERI